MPFIVTCQCGKKLRVADENQGKKVRCPACQGLVVAQPEPAAEEAPRQRPQRDEDEDKEDRPRRRPRPPEEDDEDRPTRAKRRRNARDDDEEEDRPSRKTKARSSARTWLWVGCGCSSLLFLGCAGVILLAIVFGGKGAPEDQLAGSWEVDRDSGAPIPKQFNDDKTFGFQFLKEDGTFYENWNGSVHKGKWRAEKGDKPDTLFALISYPPKTHETILRFRPVDRDHIIFDHSGQEVLLKRSERQLAQAAGDTRQPGGDEKAPAGGAAGGKGLVILKEHTKDVVSLAFWGDNLLASASWDGTVKVWELPAEKSKYTLKGHTGQARSLAFLGSGATLASGGGNPDQSAKGGEVKVWDLATGAEKSTPYKGDRPVEAVAANRNGRVMAWSNFADVIIWDVSGNRQAATLPAHSWEVAAVAIPEAGRTVAVAGGQEVRLWDLPPLGTKPGKPAGAPSAARLTLKAPKMLRSVAFSLDGQSVAAGGEEGTVAVWDVASGGQKWTKKVADAGEARGVAFSRDGRVLIAACGPVVFWEAASGAELGRWSAEHEGHFAYSVAVSADGKKLATGALNGSIKVWDFSAPPAGKR